MSLHIRSCTITEIACFIHKYMSRLEAQVMVSLVHPFFNISWRCIKHLTLRKIKEYITIGIWYTYGIWVYVYTHIHTSFGWSANSMQVSMWACMVRPENKLERYSLGTMWHRESPAWNLPHRVSWLAVEPKRPSCLCLPRTETGWDCQHDQFLINGHQINWWPSRL